MPKRGLPELFLAIILIGFLSYVARLQPAQLFGHFYDDSVYFSSAQALAQGRGYIQPGLPGSPTQTKYPVLYPWLLSWVWKWDPSFPDNVVGAVWMTAIFACWFLVAALELLRGLRGVGTWAALAIVGLCAFHPFFVAFSRAVMSEIPFMALALTAAVVAESNLTRNGRTIGVAATAALAGLSVMTRALGVAVAAGLVAAALHRRAYRQAAVFVFTVAPFLAAALLWPGGGSQLPAWVEAGGPGLKQTWLYHTSYAGFWKLSVPDTEVLLAVLAFNLKALLATPAALCLFPPIGGPESYPGVILSITLTLVIVAGLVRQVRSQQCKPIHFVLPFYCALLLGWNHRMIDRGLLFLLPLLYGGLWIEIRHVLSMLRKSFRAQGRLGEKVVAASLALGLVGALALAVEHYVAGLRPLLEAQVRERISLNAEKEQLYDWIRKNTDPDARFVACEDAVLYLHTGRQAMWPIAFSTAPFFTGDQTPWYRDVERMGDVARGIGANYWVIAANDFSSQEIDKKIAEVKSVFPLVFRSREGRVQLYDLSCLHEPERTGCGAASAVLPN